MRNKLLQTLAALAWGATIMGAFTGYDGDLRHYSGLDERLWFTMLGIAVVSSLPVVFGTQLADRIDRAFLAMHKAVVTRPRDAGPPSVPFPAISMDDYRQPGRHANHG